MARPLPPPTPAPITALTAALMTQGFDHVLHIDFETASEKDLREVGTDVYARHPSTRVLMTAWRLDHNPVEQGSEDNLDEFPDRLRELILNPRVLKIAHNAQFERAILEHVLGVSTPAHEWRCTMAQAFMLGLPGALKKLGEILLLPEHMQKMHEGSRLIRKFCAPRKPTKNKPYRWCTAETDPEDWALFLKYNRQDVLTEEEALRRMARFQIHPNEWSLWFLDQRINARGWPIDRRMVENAYNRVEDEDERLRGVLAGLTGLSNPNSDAKFGPWIRERGYKYGDLRKETVKRAMAESDLHPGAKTALQIRASLKRTSVKKYGKVLASMNEHDRLCYTFQFAGAQRTSRWAGRVAQFHNLAKPPKHLEEPHILNDIIDSIRAEEWDWIEAVYGDQMTALSAVLRGMVRAPDGRKLVVADLAAIEARVLAWVTHCVSMLQVFIENKDIYKAFGVHLFQKPYEQITKKERNDSKPGALGAGYRLGGGEEVVDKKTGDLKRTGLWGYAKSLGVDLTREQAHRSVAVFREVYPEVVAFWGRLEYAAKKVIRSGPGVVERVGLVAFEIQGPFLLLHLPSGRSLHYLRPKIEMRKTPWGEERWTITYEGMEDDGEKKQWGRIPTHGGKLTENICQAIARDILAYGLVEAESVGFDLVGHVHDEIVAEVDQDSALGVDELCAAMTKLPGWAKGLPLGAAGFETIFYRKD